MDHEFQFFVKLAGAGDDFPIAYLSRKMNEEYNSLTISYSLFLIWWNRFYPYLTRIRNKKWNNVFVPYSLFSNIADSLNAESSNADSPNAHSPNAHSPNAVSPGADKLNAESPIADSPNGYSPNVDSLNADSLDAYSRNVDSSNAPRSCILSFLVWEILDARSERTTASFFGLMTIVCFWHFCYSTIVTFMEIFFYIGRTLQMSLFLT